MLEDGGLNPAAREFRPSSVQSYAAESSGSGSGSGSHVPPSGFIPSSLHSIDPKRLETSLSPTPNSSGSASQDRDSSSVSRNSGSDLNEAEVNCAVCMNEYELSDMRANALCGHLVVCKHCCGEVPTPVNIGAPNAVDQADALIRGRR